MSFQVIFNASSYTCFNNFAIGMAGFEAEPIVTDGCAKKSKVVSHSSFICCFMKFLSLTFMLFPLLLSRTLGKEQIRANGT